MLYSFQVVSLVPRESKGEDRSMGSNVFDVIVIGGGPAGMIAAGAASARGASVALLEKGDALGVKLSITGKGRCNLAHMEDDPLKLVEPFGKNGRFILSALSRFGVKETLSFFEKRGIDITVERGSRVFPGPGQKSEDVIQALRDFMADGGVKIFTSTQVKSISVRDESEKEVLTDSGLFKASSVIIATGGLSYPETGSTGDGYRWARETGHSIVPTKPAICPIRTKEIWCKTLQGLTLKNVELSLWQGGRELSRRFGEMLFTHFGVSGPIVMDMAAEVDSALEKGPATLFLDLKPALDRAKLDNRILRDLKEHPREILKNGLKDLLPRAIIPVVLDVAGVDGSTKVDEVTKDQRASLVEVLKAMPLTPVDLLGYRWAVVTKGGVSLKDVNPKTMESKRVPGLFFAGEVLDLNGPTGGYNLQICWSSGFVSGEEAADRAML